MIVSHDRRFVFVKTRKTASTSMELALARFVGPSGIITPHAAGDEELQQQLGAPGPQNHLVDPAPVRFAWRVARVLAGKRPTQPDFWDHMPYRDIVRRVPAARDYFSFAFVRNPWDALVSRYWFERARRDDPSLSIDDVIAIADPRDNWESITIGGRIAVDFVGRYEDLEHDFGVATDRIGLEAVGPLPRAKADTGRDGLHHSDVLEPRHIELVRARCPELIDAFGYEV